MRRLLTTGFIFIGLLSLTACSGTTAQTAVSRTAEGNSGSAASGQQGAEQKKETAPVKIRFGVDSGTFSLQFRVAKDQGFFKNHGIDAELTTFSFGIDTLNAAVLNQTDTAIAMDYAELTRLSAGNLKIISLVGSPSANNSILFVKNGINKPQDLKGRHVGVGSGTVNEYIWAKYLNANQLDNKSVKLEPLQSSAELYTAFERGDIEAAWFGGSFAEKARQLPGVKQLDNLDAIKFRMRGYLSIQEPVIKQHPEAVSGILKALDEATAYIRQHPDEAAQLAFKELKLPADAVAKELKNEWEFAIRLKQEDVDHLQAVYEWSHEKGLIKDNLVLKDKIELAPLKAALPDSVTYKP